MGQCIELCQCKYYGYYDRITVCRNTFSLTAATVCDTVLRILRFFRTHLYIFLSVYVFQCHICASARVRYIRTP